MSLQAALSVIILAGLGSACFKLEKKPPNHGPQIEENALSKALQAPLHQQTPLSMQEGEFYIYQTSQTISNSKPLPVQRVGVQVSQRVEKSEDGAIDFLFHKITFDLQEDPPKEKQESWWERCPVKASAQDTQPEEAPCHRLSSDEPETNFTPLSLAKSLLAQPLTKVLKKTHEPLLESLESLSNRPTSTAEKVPSDPSEEEPYRITYHRLAVQKSSVPPPAAVKERDNCSGLSPCSLQLTSISFDEVRWYSEEDFDKFHYEFHFGENAPYLARLLKFCFSTKIEQDGSRWPIQQCQEAADFSFGSQAEMTHLLQKNHVSR